MPPLPATNLRSNVTTWAVPAERLPATAAALLDALPREAFDPGFLGQGLETTYFDTPRLALRRARRPGTRYLTLRLRCYGAGDDGEVYSLSAKTESEKWRQEIAPDLADALLHRPTRALLAALLPGNLLARLQQVTGDDPLVPAVTVCCRRYAVEDDRDRLTLDVGVATDTGKCLPAAILEFKSGDADAPPPGSVEALGLRPVKLSKFLWATDWR
jgi:hypothetical protein